MLKTMLRLSVAPVGVLLLLLGCSRAGENDPMTAKALEILQLTGAADAMTRATDAMMPIMVDSERKAHPELTDAFWDEFSKQFRDLEKAKTDDINKKLAQLYSQHFSEAEMDQLIAFYKTPAGAKLIKETPILMQESLKVGQGWGQEIANEAASGAREAMDKKTPAK
jgi:hypothetical protein